MARPKGSKNKPKAVPEPGTRAFAAAAPAGMALPEAYTDEGIARRQEGKSVAAVRVIRDGWYQALVENKDPFRAAEKAYCADHPDRAVRFISDAIVERRGRRGWEPAEDRNGKEIKVGDVKMGWMPQGEKAARNAYMRSKSEGQTKRILNSVDEAAAKIARETNGAVGRAAAGDLVQQYGGGTTVSKGREG